MIRYALNLIVLLTIMLPHSCTAQYYHLFEKGRRVRTGLEVFCDQKAKRYAGMKAAVVTNNSGYDYHLQRNIYLLKNKGIQVTMILEPEHGLYGYKNEMDYSYGWFDEHTGLPVYNLYGAARQQLRHLFSGVDLVIFDIQDMGMRCYTYITDLKVVMDALDGSNRELIVLDRPNPTSFLGIDGADLDPRFATAYVSAFPAPFMYDMTIGEAARYYCGIRGLDIKLTVVPMNRYRRGMRFHETGLPWIPPSPNLPTYESAVVYTALVLMEGINLSLGRGTAKPFEYIGAPWIDPEDFCAEMDRIGLKQFRFKPVYFKPTFSKYAGFRCGGAQIFYLGGRFSPTETAYRMISAIMKRYPYLTSWVCHGGRYDIDALAGTDMFRRSIQEGKSWEEFQALIAAGRVSYMKKRKKYLLY